MLREMTDSAFAHSFKRFAQLAVVGLALAGLAACGGGGSSTPAKTTPTPTPTPPPEIPITPAATDHPNTLAEAVVIAAGATVEGSIGSPDDVDFFKLQLTDPGTVTFWTTGEVDTAIALLDGEGADLSPTVSEGRVSKATTLDEVFARVSGREGSTGDYNLHNEVVMQPGQSPGGTPVSGLPASCSGPPYRQTRDVLRAGAGNPLFAHCTIVHSTVIYDLDEAADYYGTVPSNPCSLPSSVQSTDSPVSQCPEPYNDADVVMSCRLASSFYGRRARTSPPLIETEFEQFFSHYTDLASATGRSIPEFIARVRKSCIDASGKFTIIRQPDGS